MKKITFILFLLFGSFVTNAAVGYSWDNCVLDHVEKTNCYKVEVSLYWTDEHGMKTRLARGEMWIGSDCEKVNHANIIGNTSCPPFEVNGQFFYTSESSDKCIGAYLNDPILYEGCMASVKDMLAATGMANKGVKPQLSDGLSIYPNPAHSYVIISAGFTNTSSPLFACVYDMAGKRIFFTQLPGGKLTLSLKDFVPGTYNVVIEDNKGAIATRKLVVQ